MSPAGVNLRHTVRMIVHSGTFEPSAHVPEDKVVVLGLVPSKTSTRI